MTTQLEHAANMLFPSEGSRAANIKFFSGRDRVCAERLAGEFLRVEAQIENGDVQPSSGIGD